MRRLRTIVSIAGVWSVMIGSARAAAQTATSDSLQTPPAALRGVHGAELRSLQARIDSTLPRMAVLRRQDSVFNDSLRRALMGKPREIDTVMVGPFRVIGSRRAITRYSRHLTQAWERLAPIATGTEADLKQAILVISPFAVKAPDLHPNTYDVRFLEQNTEEQKQWFAERVIGAVMTKRLPASVQTWLEQDVIAGFGDLQEMQRRIAFARDQKGIRLPDGKVVKHSNRCADRVAMDCRRLLALAEPVDPAGLTIMRASFITHVLEHAPPGTLAKSTADGSPVIPALERIGGAPVDTLIGRWLRDVDAQRATGFPDAARSSISTILWIAVLAAFAMRSTRWRLG